MSTNIVQEGEDILRQKAQQVPKHTFLSGVVKDIVRRMHRALESREEGVAIAAPQIGEPYAMFMVSSKIFYREKKLPPLVFVNPTLVSISKKKEPMEEGCLSVPDNFGLVERSVEAKIRALDQDGEPFELEGKGLLAQIFQHEIDHLNGILFIDKALELRPIRNDDEA